MEGRHAVPPDPLDESLPRIVGINSPELRLHRAGTLKLVLVVLMVEIACEAYNTARIDKPRRHHGRLEHLEARRDGHIGGAADRGHLALPDDDDTILYHGSRHGVDLLAPDRQLR